MRLLRATLGTGNEAEKCRFPRGTPIRKVEFSSFLSAARDAVGGVLRPESSGLGPTLMGLWMSAIIILAGAELNSEIEHQAVVAQRDHAVEGAPKATLGY